MLEIRRAERHGIALRPKRLRAFQHPLPLVSLARAREREAEVVGGGHVVRLVGDRGTEEGDGLCVLAVLQVNLALIDKRPDVAGVDLPHALEKACRILVAVFGARDETKHIRWLRGRWQEARTFAGFARGAREVLRVEATPGSN